MNDKSTLEKRLNEKFEEFILFFNLGGPYSSIKILGELYNCVLKLDKTIQPEWLERIRDVCFSEVQLQIIVDELEKDIKNIERLLSIFNVWIEEEIVLILTLRIEVELISNVLTFIGYNKVSADFSSIDEKILQISQAEDSKRAFSESVSLIKKNWGMPITNKWLDL